MTVPTLSGDAPAWYDRKRVVQLVAFVASIVGAAFALFMPAYESTLESWSSSGETSVETQTQTLLEVNGPSVIGLILVPIILTGISLVVSGRARVPVSIVATVLLVVLVFISGATIGLFYAMAAIAAIVALFVPARSRRK